MYSDLSTMGIAHMDVKYGNILLAPEPLKSPFKAYTSPHWGKPYQFRIIDFDQSTKTNIKKRVLAELQHCAIGFLLHDIPARAIYYDRAYEDITYEDLPFDDFMYEEYP